MLWALALSWIIYACYKGYGGIINWILSFPIYQTLAKLTFAIYLLHYPLLILVKASIRTPEYWNPFQIFNYFLAIWGLCIIFAIPCHLIFEKPIPNIETSLYKLFGKSKDDVILRNKLQRRSFFRLPRINIRQSMRTMF